MKFIRLRKNGELALLNLDNVLCFGPNQMPKPSFPSATFCGIPGLWYTWDDPVNYIYGLINKDDFLPVHREGKTFFINCKFIKSISSPISPAASGKSRILVEQDWLDWDEDINDIIFLLTQRGYI